MRSSQPLAVLALALLPGAGASRAPGGWRLFRDPGGFTVSYPGAWVPIPAHGHLALRSSPGGAEGVIIKPGQAYLWVAAEDSGAGRPLDAVIGRYTAGVDTVLTRGALPAPPTTAACATLTEVVTREPIVPRDGALAPVPDILNDHYFCPTERGVIVATLRYYAVDRRWRAYRAIVRQVARSIRLAQ